MAAAAGYGNSAVANATYSITGQVSAGQYHTVMLRADGTVWASGYNNNGQIGDGTTTNRTAPVQVSSLSNVVQVGAGAYHSVALKSDGTVWSWGLNSSGQIGDNTNTQRSTPVQVKKSGGATALTNIVAIAIGGYHNFALDSSGNVWAWGLNSNGQIGDGTTIQRKLAVQLTTLSGVTVQDLFAGEYHSLLLTTSGTVWAWGLNSGGQVGDGTTTSRSTPVAVTGLSGVTLTQLSGGSNFTLALASDGTVWAWGYNDSGQIGDGTTTQRNSPIHLAGLSSAVAVEAGYGHSGAIKSDGTVWTWGSNSFGELGDGTILQRTGPVQAVGISGAVELAEGDEHSLVLKSDGSLWSWGYDVEGQLANGSISAVANVSPVLGLGGVSQISSGGLGYHSLFINGSGAVYAMGQNCSGQIGNGTTTYSAGPSLVNASNLNSAIDCAVGTYHSLAVRSDGTVWSWGLNANGQLGNNSTTNSSVPVQASGLTGIVTVAGGSNFSVALKNDGTIWSWGGNNGGQLGEGDYNQHTTPAQVRISSTSFLTGIVQVVCGDNSVAALKSDGTVWVWGTNAHDQMAGNVGAHQLYAVEAQDPNDSTGYLTNVSSIAAGENSVLALKNDGTLWGFGGNDLGQIGPNGGVYDSAVPVSIPFSSPVLAIASGYVSGYAMTSDGKVWSWGDNNFGELGDGTLTSRSTVAQTQSVQGVAALGAGTYLGLMLKDDGTVFAWGGQNDGQLGESANYNLPTAAPVFNFMSTTLSPTVAITAPANNSSLPLGSSATLTASASETGGTVASVSYYINSALNGTSTNAASNFRLGWTSSTWGSYPFTAVATDTAGNKSYPSAPVTVQISADSDSNGLADWWEIKYFGHIGNDPNSDPDGSGYTLLQDYQYGANPTNPSDQPILGSTPPTHGPGCLPPTFSKAPGTYYTDQYVHISSTPAGANIYYTLDGSTPTTASTEIVGGGWILIPAQAGTSTTVRAIAASSGNATSMASSALYTFPSDLGLVPPTNVIASQGAADGEIDVSWDNHRNRLDLHKSLSKLRWWCELDTHRDDYRHGAMFLRRARSDHRPVLSVRCGGRKLRI